MSLFGIHDAEMAQVVDIATQNSGRSRSYVVTFNSITSRSGDLQDVPKWLQVEVANESTQVSTDSFEK